MRIAEDVVALERVAVGAVRLRSLSVVHSPGYAAPYILSVRYWLEVVGTNAARVATQMVELQTLRDRPHRQLVSPPMS